MVDIPDTLRDPGESILPTSPIHNPEADDTSVLLYARAYPLNRHFVHSQWKE